MTSPIRSTLDERRRSDEELPPELLRIIEGLAEAQAREDYAARFGGEMGSRE